MKNRSITCATILLALGFLALCLFAQAVSPPPDGGYAGNNTAEGSQALQSLTGGIDNTALGFQTLFHNTAGNSNTAEGFRALFANTNGRQNTATGVNALASNTTGSFNTANGVNALDHNIDGGNNTATGVQALFSNTSGNFNTAAGVTALFHNTFGFRNTASGFGALFSNINGSDNTAIGSSALVSNIAGHSNTAIGANALIVNTGSLNTAVGVNALDQNRDGTLNTATGVNALVNNETGGNNTAIGANALDANTSGGANTALGYGAGANVTTGSFNVYIGTNVGGVADEVGHTYISNIASTQQNLSPVTVNLMTGLLGHEVSSRRYKEDIKPMDKASEALFALKPVTYRYKKEIDKSQAIDYGLIAEEVARVDPRLAVRDGKGQIESIRYNAISVMLLNEFLKEHSKVQELEKGMAALTAQLKEQATQINKVSAEVELSKPSPRVVSLPAVASREGGNNP